MAVTKSAPRVYVVTGASRGLGLEFVKQILLEQSSAKVFAGARNPAASAGLQALLKDYPDRLTLVTLDLSDEANIKAGAADIAAALPDGAGVDVLINNAGIVGEHEGGGSGFPNTPGADIASTFNVNVVGTYATTVALLPLLRKGTLQHVVNLSTFLGSLDTVSATAPPGAAPEKGNAALNAKFLSYRISKAALNMATAAVANALKDEGFTVIAMHPGWVATEGGNAIGDMIGIKGVAPSLTPPQSVEARLGVIEKLTPAQNGKFLTWEGKEYPW